MLLAFTLPFSFIAPLFFITPRGFLQGLPTLKTERYQGPTTPPPTSSSGMDSVQLRSSFYVTPRRLAVTSCVAPPQLTFVPPSPGSSFTYVRELRLFVCCAAPQHRPPPIPTSFYFFMTRPFNPDLIPTRCHIYKVFLRFFPYEGGGSRP